MPGSFFDTNILLSIAMGDAAKAQRAEDLILIGGMISVQVLNEAANVLRRKLQLSWPKSHIFLKTIRDLLRVHPVTIATHESALILAQRFGFSIYDAMIVASAMENGCDTLWSEDMHNGLVVGNRLRIVNPFVSV